MKKLAQLLRIESAPINLLIGAFINGIKYHRYPLGAAILISRRIFIVINKHRRHRISTSENSLSKRRRHCPTVRPEGWIINRVARIRQAVSVRFYVDGNRSGFVDGIIGKNETG